MRKPLLLMLIISAFVSSLHAQGPEERIEHVKNNYPTEKIFIHYDKESYVAGETIWFKAYLFNGFTPTAISTSIEVDLVNEAGKILQRKILPVMGGAAVGNFDLDKNLPQANYSVRAHTRWMKNFGIDYFYYQTLTVYNPSTPAPAANAAKQYTVYFLPEGGNFVGNVNNVIAFKATDENSLPVNVEGSVVDSKGNNVATFKSVHNGMGTFSFSPTTGETYVAKCRMNNIEKTIALPAVNNNGVTLSIVPDSKGKVFIINKADDGRRSFDVAYILGVVENNLVFKAALPQDKNTIRGIIPTKDLPSGILQITVFNPNNQPIAERLTFVDNKEYLLAGDFKTDTVNTSPRSRNAFTFHVPDTIDGTFSVSVTDADRELASDGTDNLVTRLLLTDDVRGYVHQPQYYFAKDDEATRQHLELVLMTNGWRRFNWNQVLQNKLPIIQYKDGNYVTISGIAMKQGTDRPLTEGELVTIIKTKDSSTNYSTIPISADGSFNLAGMIFNDTAALYYQNSTKKVKDKLVTLAVKSPAISQMLFVDPGPWIGRTRRLAPTVVHTEATKALYAEVLGKLSRDAVYLGEVIVQTRKKTPTQAVEERYTRGAFTTNAQKTYDFLNDPLKFNVGSIFDYMRSRIPGVNVLGNFPNFTLNYRNTRSLTGGLIPMIIFLDEVPTPASTVAMIPMNQIAMIKVFGNGFVGGEGGSPGGAVAIYTKKGEDMSTFEGYANMNMMKIEGYSSVKEFFSPVYDSPKDNATVPDNRTTLLWDPYLSTDIDNRNLNIRFYNADKAKRFRVVLQGFTSDGRMVSIDRIVQ